MALKCYLTVKGFHVGFHYLTWCMVWMVPGVHFRGAGMCTLILLGRGRT